MEREKIINNTLDLPQIEAGTVASDDEIWEEDDGGAHFKVTKEYATAYGIEVVMYIMSVSGAEEERHRVITEFIDVFGKPATENTVKATSGPIDFISWLVSKKETR